MSGGGAARTARGAARPAEAGPGRGTFALLSVGTGLAVASNYYMQPLLGSIGRDLDLPEGRAGLLVTVAQTAYAAALLFVLPLGDRLERRRLVSTLAWACAASLALMASARSWPVLLLGAGLVGLCSVVTQVMVPYAASLAAPERRGRVVGTVMAGLLCGILAARTAAGALAQWGGWPTVYWCAAALLAAFALAAGRLLPPYREREAPGYLELVGSVFTLLAREPVLRLRAAYGALSFGAFSALWTSLSFLLSGPPHHYSPGAIGLFGLAGLAGALAAARAGRLADRGRGQAVTGLSAVLLLVVWLPLALGERVPWVLAAGIVLLDLGAQALHITNQSEIYRLAPAARSRLTSAYMTAYFLAGAVASALSSLAWTHLGWGGVCLVGGAFGAGATVLWALSSRRAPRQRRAAGGA
ncbi:MFS transporter [Streptomyces hoynatensis]|uniref:MFS transporter n=1 Tax=Streptomyces hoynatensis TaxID=1141874 RepID=A0A3A9YUV4_9ACTN|nr:MFS transporter [Streptomyces hoynatensis]RKN38996.1 MFS transporter [Streptomyces hoynatensis]